MLKTELERYYVKRSRLTDDEMRYILDPADVYGPEYPGEAFRVLKEKFRDYRTGRLVLEARGEYIMSKILMEQQEN